MRRVVDRVRGQARCPVDLQVVSRRIGGRTNCHATAGVRCRFTADTLDDMSVRAEERDQMVEFVTAATTAAAWSDRSRRLCWA